MIPAHILEDVQGYLMDAMTALYDEGRGCEEAQGLASILVQIHDDIAFDLVTRDVLA